MICILITTNPGIWARFSPPLKAYFDQLTNKNTSILIPGAGNAYEAEYLVNNGFTKCFCLRLCRYSLTKSFKTLPENKTRKFITDRIFLRWKIRNSIFIIEQTFFCAIGKSLRKKYFKKMHELLNANGKLVGLLFNDKLNEDKPPYGGTKEEYKEYFKDLFTPKTYETAYNSFKTKIRKRIIY